MDDDDLHLAVSGGDTVDYVAIFLRRSVDEVMKRSAELGVRWRDVTHQ